MPNENEEREDKPRFQIIDNRLLSDEERSGKSTAQTANSGASSLIEQPGQAVSAPIAAGDAADATETIPADQMMEIEDDEERELTDEEIEQMTAQVENEQFVAMEAEIGRPLTDEEKTEVRALMQQRAETMSRLEVAPLLLQTVTELPRYAAVHLGLIANPYTGLIARNDAEARLAIDAFGAMYETLKTRIDPRAAGELARVLNDLRSNYTRITGGNFNPPSPLITGPRIIR